MTIDTIYELLIAILPALTSILSVVVVAAKVLKKFSDLKGEFEAKTDYQEIQKSFSKVIDENLQLKQEVKRLQTQVDKVRRN